MTKRSSKKNNHRAGKKKQEKKYRLENQPLFALQDAGPKGYGLFATRDILPGKRIIEERPLFTVAIQDHMNDPIIAGFTSLSPADQELFLGLCSHETYRKETTDDEDLIRADSRMFTVYEECEPHRNKIPSLDEISNAGEDAAEIQEFQAEEFEHESGGCKSPEEAIGVFGHDFDHDFESSLTTHRNATTAFRPGLETTFVDSVMRDNHSGYAQDFDDLEESLETRVIKIWRTNSYALDDGSTLNGAGICLTAARLNHACAPNVYCAYNSTSGNLTVQAIRPIAAGEELCASYIQGAYMLHSERQRELDNWGFKCSCETCSSENELQRQELKALAKEAEIARQNFAALTDTQVAHLADILSRMADLMSKEGLRVPDLADVCFGAAACYAKIGRLDEAQYLQQNMLDISLCCYGVDSPAFLAKAQ